MPVIDLERDLNSEDSATVDTDGNSALRPHQIECDDNNDVGDSGRDSNSSSSSGGSAETIASVFTAKLTLGGVPSKIKKRKLSLPVLDKNASEKEL